MKAAEESLLKQLTELVPDCTSPSVREHTAEAMAAVVGVSGGLRLAATVNALVDTVRVKDEGSEAVLLARRASAHVVGALCRRLGRAMGLHSQDVLQALTRAARANDWRLRLWALRALADAVSGFGAGVRAFTRDVNKCIKTGLADKVEPVRAAAARAATEMVAATTLLQTTELENMFAACVKGLDGAEYNTRVALTATAGRLLSASLEPDAWKGIKASKVVSQADVLSLMRFAYVRNSSRHVRVGVTQILVAFFAHRGATWVERNVALVIETMLGIFTTKTTNTAAEALYTRKCAGFVLVTCLGRRMGEKGRLDAVRTLAKVAKRHMEAVTRGDGNNDKMDHSHAIACTLETMAGK